MSFNILSPSLIPGPRYELIEVLFALSNDALNINSISSSSEISFSFFAILVCLYTRKMFEIFEQKRQNHNHQEGFYLKNY